MSPIRFLAIACALALPLAAATPSDAATRQHRPTARVVTATYRVPAATHHRPRAHVVRRHGPSLALRHRTHSVRRG